MTSTQLGAMMKDHEIREIVNQLRDIAEKYGQTQQLRERIAGAIVPLLSASKPADGQAVAERCARFAELYRDEHATGKLSEEACDAIAEACRQYAAPAQSGKAVALKTVQEAADWMFAAPAAVVLDDERAAFKEWINTQSSSTTLFRSYAWAGWQARAASPQAVPAQTLALTDDARDAVRYRWLRHADLDALAASNWGNGDVYEGDAFDAAIDAAIAAQASGGDRE